MFIVDSHEAMRIAVGASSGGQVASIAATMVPLSVGTAASAEDATGAGVGLGVSTGAATTAELMMVVATASSVGAGVAVGKGATKAGAALMRSSSS